MMPVLCSTLSPRHQIAAVAGLAAVAIALLGGCTTPLQVTSDPPGATLFVNNQSIGVTPMQVTWEGKKPVPVEFRLEGYFPESLVYQPDSEQHALSARLEPKTLSKA